MNLLASTGEFESSGEQACSSKRAPWSTSDRALVVVFLALSFVSLLGRIGADSAYDETIYCAISHLIWHPSKAYVLPLPGAPAFFHDNPILVPLALAPAVTLGKSLVWFRLLHWLLFVAPGLFVVALFLKPAGRLAMTVGFTVLLLNRLQNASAARINLDQGLSSWGLIALYCFMQGRRPILGLTAIALVTLCKYQAVVLCLALFLATIQWNLPWKRLLTYGLVSALAMGLWLGLLLIVEHGWWPGRSAWRFGWDTDFLSNVASGRGKPILGLAWQTANDLSLPVLLLAIVGFWMARRNRLVACLGLFVLLTLAFNIATAVLPGGLTDYLVPTYGPLAIGAGYGFADRRIPFYAALAIMMGALLKSFLPIPAHNSAQVGALLALLGIVGLCTGTRWSFFVLIVALFVSALPFSLAWKTDGGADEAVQNLTSRARERNWTVGTWEDPRVSYYLNGPVCHAVWEDGCDRIDYFIILKTHPVRDQQRWTKFEDLLRRVYEIDEECGAYTGYRHRQSSSPTD